MLGLIQSSKSAKGPGQSIIIFISDEGSKAGTFWQESAAHYAQRQAGITSLQKPHSSVNGVDVALRVCEKRHNGWRALVFRGSRLPLRFQRGSDSLKPAA